MDFSRGEFSVLIRDLVEYVYQASPDTLIRDVKATLEGEDPMSAVVVTEGQRPLGLVMGLHLDRTLSRRFGVALYHQKPVQLIMDASPLVVQGDTPVERVADLAMRRDKTKIFDHIIVTEAGRLEGIVSVQNILKTLVDLQTFKTAEIASFNKELRRSKTHSDAMNRALRNAYERLREVDKMKTDFLSMVSHELRTPLTSVLGFSDIALLKLKQDIIPALTADQPGPLKAAQAIQANLDIILMESERLTALINDVLDIAKLEAGKVEWKKSPMDVNEAVRRGLAATAALTRAKGLAVVQELAPDLPQVFGDMDRIIQVVINLLSNAVKFTPQGAVTCRTSLCNDMAEVRIVDTGIGIAESDLDKVFHKFRQVGDTLTQKPTGTGLGLPICKQIVESHGGVMGLTSTPGAGSQFHFTLPLAEHVLNARVIPNLDSLAQRLQSRAGNGNGHAPEVLVVDHDPTIRNRLRERLTAKGLQVSEAVSEIDVRLALRENRPDLIILRFMMPTAMEYALVDLPAVARIPLMMLSVREEGDHLRMALDRYLPNPVTGAALRKEIEHLSRHAGAVRTLLVADENPGTVRTMCRYLAERNFTVMSAAGHAQCLRSAREQKPDLVIAGALMSQRHNLVADLRFSTPSCDANFILLGGNRVPGVGRTARPRPEGSAHA